jgi:hypothetical protein
LRFVQKAEKRIRGDVYTDVVNPCDQSRLFSSTLATKKVMSVASNGKASTQYYQRHLELARPRLQPCLSLDDTVYDFFYLNYTVEIPQLRNVKPVEFRVAQVTPDNALGAAIRAVGAAGLGCFHSSGEFEIYKQRMYSLAVRSLNSLLRDPSSVKNDKTLLTVLLLDHFEEMDRRSHSRLGARQAHLFGAVSLLQLRGFSQLQTSIEIRLFSQLTSALTNFCIRNQVDLPEELNVLMEFCSSCVVKEDPSWHVFRNKIKFAMFYLQAVRNTNPLPHAVIQEALEFDRLFADISRFTMPGWTYRAFRTDQENDMVVDGTYHVYDNYMAATVWNDMRGHRLLANRLVFESTLHIIQGGGPISDDVRKSHERSKTRIRGLQLDILATVPQHLGLVSMTQPEKGILCGIKNSNEPNFFWTAFQSILHNPTTSIKMDESLPLTRMFGGCLLPFSLALVGLVDLGGAESLVQTTLRILKTVSGRLAVQQARFYAAEIEASKGRDNNLLKF